MSERNKVLRSISYIISHFSWHIVPTECEKYDILYLLISLSKLFRIGDILKWEICCFTVLYIFRSFSRSEQYLIIFYLAVLRSWNVVIFSITVGQNNKWWCYLYYVNVMKTGQQHYILGLMCKCHFQDTIDQMNIGTRL